MQAFDFKVFLQDPYVNAVVLIIFGLVGLLYGAERVLDKIPILTKYVDTKDKQTKFTKYLTIVFSVIAIVWTISLIYFEATFKTFTLVLLLIYAFVLLAHPIKDLEGWKFLLIGGFFVVLLLAGLILSGVSGKMTIIRWILLLVFFLAFLVLFLMVFFVEETVIDPLLKLIGWAPMVTVLCLLVILHGLVIVFLGNIEGLSYYFPSLPGFD